MIKSFFVYLPSTFLMRACSFLTMIAGTHLLVPKQFGYLSLVFLIGEFVETTTTGWTRLVLTRFGARDTKRLPRSFAFKVARFSAVCAVIGIALSLWATRVFAPENAAALSLAVSLYIAAAAVVRFGITLHQAAQGRRTASILEGTRAVLVLAAATGAMVATGDFLVASLCISAINLTIGCVAVTTGFRRTCPSEIDRTPARVVFWFAFPMVVLAVLAQVSGSLDKVLLKAYYDAAALGFYTAAFAVGRNGFDVIAAAFNIETFVSLSSMFNAGQRKQAGRLLSRQMAYILAIALPAAGTLMASRELIARVLFPPAYLDTFVIAIPWIALGAIALNIKNFVYDNILHMHLRNLRQIPSPLTGAAISAVVGLVMLPSDPASGAALMFASGSIAATIVSIALTRPLMRIRIPLPAIVVSAGIGLGVWGLEHGVNAALASVLPNTILLGILAAIGTLGAGTALLFAQILVQPKGKRVAISFITPNPDRVTGVSSYAESLFEAMTRLRGRPSLVLLTNVSEELFGRIPRDHNVEWIVLPACPRGFPYKLYSLIIHDIACWRARLGGCGSYVSATAAGALFPIIRQFVTLHDLYDLDQRFRPWRTVFYASLLWRWLAFVSQRIICVSASTAAEARLLVPFAVGKTCVIKEASRFIPEDPSSSDDPARFLFVANIQPTKNVECLLEALWRSRDDIGVDWIGRDPAGLIDKWITRQGNPSGFRPMGSPSDADLRAAYRRAFALVVPSWKEGFCLPVLEAHAFGVPVIASDIPILREVAGDGALFFDPHDPDALLAAMYQLIGDPGLRMRLSRAASANARLYSWDRAATETLHLVEAV
jgi:glycosyltransferase involved in cell wall biosynthesis/O-antigen/teichoic acid export membrane protein